MKNKATQLIGIMATVGFAALLSSCAVTTRSFEGTSETAVNTADASSEFTSSTFPRDVSQSQADRVDAFATANLDRLREDMARGEGEHLTAFSHLLNISPNHRTEFFALAKGKYPDVFRSEPTTPKEMVARLTTELDAYPGWRQ